jgi:hypothetical protein
MPKERILNAVEDWITANDNDVFKVDFLRYLLEHAIGKGNAVPTETIMENIGFNKRTADFQQEILAPLKRERGFFVGSCTRGIFLVASIEDAKETAAFYQSRIDAETFHLNNLREVMMQYNCQI